MFLVFAILLLSPAVLAVNSDKYTHLDKFHRAKYAQLSNSNATAHIDLAMTLASLPIKYYSDNEDYNTTQMVDGRSCKSWRVESWDDKYPSHDERYEAATTKFILGIGPARTASTSTFATLASNPNVCYWRQASSGQFQESAGELFAGPESFPKKMMFSHLPPSDCCEAFVLKETSWASSFAAVYDMVNMFKYNRKIKFVLTIREPTDALNSFFNDACTKGDIPIGACEDGASFVEFVAEQSQNQEKCMTNVESENWYLEGEELHKKLEECTGYAGAVQNYDYDHTYKLYADQFGKENVFCQFTGDLETASLASRRKLLDFAGLANLDESDVSNYQRPTTMYKYDMTPDQKAAINKTVSKHNTANYSEARLRGRCGKLRQSTPVNLGFETL